MPLVFGCILPGSRYSSVSNELIHRAGPPLWLSIVMLMKALANVVRPSGTCTQFAIRLNGPRLCAGINCVFVLYYSRLC